MFAGSRLMTPSTIECPRALSFLVYAMAASLDSASPAVAGSLVKGSRTGTASSSRFVAM